MGLFQTNPVTDFVTPSLNLHEEKFQHLIKDDHMIGALFYSPVCPYSRMMQPVFDQVARKLDKKLHLVRIDATKQRSEELKKYKVRGLKEHKL